MYRVTQEEQNEIPFFSETEGLILVSNVLNIVNGEYESRKTGSMIDKKLGDSLISNYKINLIN